MIVIGRIKLRFVKSTATELIKQHPDKFTASFEKNKEFLKELDIIQSVSTRNKIAGYAVKQVKNKAF